MLKRKRKNKLFSEVCNKREDCEVKLADGKKKKIRNAMRERRREDGKNAHTRAHK